MSWVSAVVNGVSYLYRFKKEQEIEDIKLERLNLEKEKLSNQGQSGGSVQDREKLEQDLTGVLKDALNSNDLEKLVEARMIASNMDEPELLSKINKAIKKRREELGIDE